MYECKKLEMEAQSENWSIKFSTEQAAILDSMKQQMKMQQAEYEKQSRDTQKQHNHEMKKMKENWNEKARIAEEKHNWEMKEQERLLKEQTAKNERQREESQYLVEQQAAKIAQVQAAYIQTQQERER